MMILLLFDSRYGRYLHILGLFLLFIIIMKIIENMDTLEVRTFIWVLSQGCNDDLICKKQLLTEKCILWNNLLLTLLSIINH